MTKTRISGRIRLDVLGLVAIFIALSGTAYATHGGTNTISSEDVIDGEVKTPDLATDAVSQPKLRDGAVGRPELQSGAVTREKINNGSVDGTKVADNSLTGADVDEPTLFNDNSLTGADIDEFSLNNLWSIGGNANTDPGADFLGTTDSTALHLRVNAARALRLEPAFDGTNESPNVIGGIADNTVTAGVHSATIGGGGRNNQADPATANRVTDHQGTVAGGRNNQAGDGAGTTSDRTAGTVGGGSSNTASGTQATVGGGVSNEASEDRATVGGGLDNTASDERATVPGGEDNVAAGGWSFAGGLRAKANHDGTFVWASAQNADMASTANNQFIARATGNFFFQDDSTLDDQGGFLNTTTGGFLSTGGVWTNNSDANLKRGFTAVDSRKVLRKVAELPVRTWSYKKEPSVRHIGPTAQDFHRAFGVGADNRHIGSVDADGVALAAIKGLKAENEDLAAEVAALEEEVAGLSGAGRPTASPLDPALVGALIAAALALGALAMALALRLLGPLARRPVTS